MYQQTTEVTIQIKLRFNTPCCDTDADTADEIAEEISRSALAMIEVNDLHCTVKEMEVSNVDVVGVEACDLDDVA